MDKADQLQQGWNEEHNCVVIKSRPSTSRRFQEAP